ncbi:MAG: hypothetical protein PHY57_10620, partial [Ignavibacterium sp.]|nr:hypothetical protein [Ignavibacterium sp.]
ILVTATFGFIQEYKAEKTIRKLRKYITIKAKVLRGGEIKVADSRELLLMNFLMVRVTPILQAL